MVASLTGFGRAEHSDAKGRICVECKAVNNRFLQIDLRLPYDFNWLDAPLRALISEKVFRGKFYMNLEMFEYAPAQNLMVNRSLLAKLFELQSDFEKEIGRPVPVSLDGLLALPGMMKCEMSGSENEKVWERVKPVVQKALQSFIEFRLREGKKLAEDLRGRGGKISNFVKSIEERVPQYRENFNERFTARISELAAKAEIDQSKLTTEIALWTDRSDITEEITRLKTHLDEFHKIMEEPGPVGRKLDFLLQEILRESNTINNKIGDLMVIQQVLEIKCELEKIREQGQNIE